jgi:hypothetical protein
MFALLAVLAGLTVSPQPLRAALPSRAQRLNGSTIQLFYPVPSLPCSRPPTSRIVPFAAIAPPAVSPPKVPVILFRS